MLLDIVKYGDPVLRQKGERVEEVTPEIRQLIDNMLETVREARCLPEQAVRPDPGLRSSPFEYELRILPPGIGP